MSQHFWQEHHARLILPILVLNSSSLVRACISAGSVFHIVGAKVRKLLYPKLIWLDFGISRSKGFLYWCCEGLSVITGCLPSQGSQGSQGKVREFTLPLEKSGKSQGI